MKTIKITIVGNSVAMRIRPPKEIPDNLNYGQILEKKLSETFPSTIVHVENLSLHRALVQDVLDSIDTYLQSYPNYFIINLGIVDACCREIPLWYSNLINKNKHTLFSRSFLCPLYYNFIKKNRKLFVKLRGFRAWENSRGFKTKYKKLLDSIIKETNSKIITLSINPTTNRVELELPGSTKNITAYNNIIKELTIARNQKFLAFDNFITEKYCPDGIHFSLEGHELVAVMLYKYLSQELKKNENSIL